MNKRPPRPHPGEPELETGRLPSPASTSFPGSPGLGRRGLYLLKHGPTGRIVAAVSRAESWWARGWGVLGRPALNAGEGLWLPRVASVHTLGVRFALDLLFLDAEGRAVRLAPRVPPGRWLVRADGARHVVELGAGTLARVIPQVGVGDPWILERRTGGAC